MNKIAQNHPISEGTFSSAFRNVTAKHFAKGGKMARRKSIKKQVGDGLSKLAFGDISDAVKLLYMSDEEALQSLSTLNLYNVSEIKRPKGGGMEIKFFDRIKACEKLMLQNAENSDSGMGFFEALEKSAENIRSVSDND